MTGDSPKRKIHKKRKSIKPNRHSESKKKKFISDNLNFLLGGIFEELYTIYEHQEMELREQEMKYSRNPNFNIIGYLKDSLQMLKKKILHKIMEISTSRSMRQMYSTDKNNSYASFNLMNRGELLSHNFSSVISVNKKNNDSVSNMLDYTRSGIDLMNSIKSKYIRKSTNRTSNQFRSKYFCLW